MYDVSSQFHRAVFGTSPVTQVLFRFADGTVLTNEDVHSSGLKLMEAANYEEEMTIGSCLSSTLSVSAECAGLGYTVCSVAPWFNWRCYDHRIHHIWNYSRCIRCGCHSICQSSVETI